MIKKVSILIAVLMVGAISNANAFGFDDVKKSKLEAQIATITTQNASNDAFLKCVATKDPSIYAIILDKSKMENLKNLTLADLQKIYDVETACVPK